jgi:hypothetical protein
VREQVSSGSLTHDDRAIGRRFTRSAHVQEPRLLAKRQPLSAHVGCPAPHG